MKENIYEEKHHKSEEVEDTHFSDEEIDITHTKSEFWQSFLVMALFVIFFGIMIFIFLP